MGEGCAGREPGLALMMTGPDPLDQIPEV